MIAALLTVGQLVAARAAALEPLARGRAGRPADASSCWPWRSCGTGTGGPGPPYTTLVFFPVITLASQRGRRGIVLGHARRGGGRLLAGPALDACPSPWTPSSARLFVTLVAVVVAATVHEITARLRARSSALLSLQMDQAVLLDRARADAVELARVADQRRAARDQLVSVIDSATEQAIIATDATGMVEVFNAGAERLLGYGQGEVVGRMRLTDFHDQAELEARRALLFSDDTPIDNPQALVDALVAPALAGRPGGARLDVRRARRRPR